jgi:DNA-binding HxlR family transcriptional regulator
MRTLTYKVGRAQNRPALYLFMGNTLNSIDTGDLLFPNCPIRNVLSRIGDKWSLLVMHTLMEHGAPMRFSAIRKAVPDISQKVLTTTLRHLEEDLFVKRVVYAEVPPRVEYCMLERGESFMAACRPMIQWAVEHLHEIVEHRELSRSQTDA